MHEEWISNLLINRSDLTRAKLELTRQLMDKAAPDALVRGYEHLIPGLALPGPNDRHVLAAAIRAGASVIVTCNLADFPPHVLGEFDIEAQHPDDFILHLLDLAPGPGCGGSGNSSHEPQKPTKTVDDYIATLAAQGLTETASELREYMVGDRS